MKTKWRCIVLGTICFIVFISYKILEPELSSHDDDSRNPKFGAAAKHGDDSSDLDQKVHHVENRIIDLQPVEGGNDVEPMEVEQSQVIQSMSNRFSPLLSYQISQLPWDIAAKWLTPRHIHPENPPELGAILQAMATSKVIMADVGYKGTQLKLTLTLEGNQKVVFKPAWYRRETVITGTPYEGKDRHNGEIAAFHLGRILELRRTPLAVGRKLDVQNEIMSVATPALSKTFFEHDGEQCFYGKCYYCKGPEDGICGQAGMMEGTVILWLPDTVKLVKHKHPWARTYRKNVEPKWAQRSDWCELVRKHNLYKQGPLLMDIIDTAIFDFIIGNADRHQFETFSGEADSMLIMLDNGKSFGNPDHDEMSILAPLYQCCVIRSHTWQRLLSLKDGVLSSVLARVLSHDPLNPVLLERHLEAMDQRVTLVLQTVDKCVEKIGVDAIVMDTNANS